MFSNDRSVLSQCIGFFICFKIEILHAQNNKTRFFYVYTTTTTTTTTTNNNNNNNNNDNNNEFAVAFPRGGSSSTVFRSNWNLEVLLIKHRFLTNQSVRRVLSIF